MEAKDLFNAESKSVISLFNRNGEFFYIPAYQRQYTWSKAQVEALLEGITAGLQNLFNDSDGYTFIGSAITIVDTSHETVQPHFHGQLPAKVHLVIDGQQRLTTLSLLLINLHSKLRSTFDQLQKKKFDELTDFQKVLFQRLGEALKNIKDCLVSDEFAGNNKTAPYVRIIRAYDDAWSRIENQRQYNSPIASIINGYGIICDGFDLNAKSKKFVPKTFSEKDRQTCNRRYKDITTILDALLTDLEPEESETFIPSAESIASSKKVLTAIGISLDEADQLGISNSHSDELVALRLLAFTNYTLNRVALTVVQVKKDDYAFDVFDALNTTGQPLAPFETFVPLVMKAVGLANYQGSPEFDAIEIAKELIGDLDLKPSRDIATASAVSFGLIECGAKIGTKIETQRLLFRSTFSRVSKFDDQRLDYLEHLNAAIFFHAKVFDSSAWKSKALPSPELEALSDDVKVCISFLNNLQHTIVIPILARFWIPYKQSVGTPAEQLFKQEFEEVVRACTAFTVLRRATTGSVDGIDSIYRDIMAGNNSPTSLAALQRSQTKWDGKPTDICDLNSKSFVSDLSRRLTDTTMGSGISTRESFITKASNVGIYKFSQPITRFMLLVAQHNTVAMPSHPGIIQIGANGTNNRFTLDHWVEENGNSVEHVVPQTKPDANINDWDDSVYELPSTVHRIGNLALCPIEVNIAASNRPWLEKRVIYKAAGSTTDAAARQILDSEGISVKDDFFGVVEHVPYLVSIGEMEDQIWDEDFIDSRSENLLGLVWDRIAPWLGIKI
jgi:hypothetical protein